MSSPKTEFIIEDLISKIFQNQYRNSKLPTERELAAQYKVSRQTIQKTLKHLKEMMLLSSQQGNGFFVNENMRGNPMVYNSMTLVPYTEIESKVISLEKVAASTQLQRIFNISSECKIWEFKRVRITNYRKTQIETGYMPCNLFPSMSPEIIEDSIQNFAIEEGYKISHFMTKYSCTQLNKEEAILLNSKKNTPAFMISSRGFLRDGSVFVSSKIIAIDYECTYVVPFNKKVFVNRRK
ncbi:transcriptional regulator, GntR family [Oribacterium sp. KHPX15]|uniref:GntR family transcriptional regulator n=1 Tax=Oribacterium sp. KHPX15 TaxID=1855342 RepID=UPI0008997B73|nr:GntR family transcriptional regulator [Oribacterium sp. KHPX15]SEA92856.1 transcriptional regulator, GntR family [Oribacterium sp. KHPX15]